MLLRLSPDKKIVCKVREAGDTYNPSTEDYGWHEAQVNCVLVDKTGKETDLLVAEEFPQSIGFADVDVVNIKFNSLTEFEIRGI